MRPSGPAQLTSVHLSFITAVPWRGKAQAGWDQAWVFCGPCPGFDPKHLGVSVFISGDGDLWYRHSQTYISFHCHVVTYSNIHSLKVSEKQTNERTFLGTLGILLSKPGKGRLLK